MTRIVATIEKSPGKVRQAISKHDCGDFGFMSKPHGLRVVVYFEEVTVTDLFRSLSRSAVA